MCVCMFSCEDFKSFLAKTESLMLSEHEKVVCAYLETLVRKTPEWSPTVRLANLDTYNCHVLWEKQDVFNLLVNHLRDGFSDLPLEVVEHMAGEIQKTVNWSSIEEDSLCLGEKQIRQAIETYLKINEDDLRHKNAVYKTIACAKKIGCECELKGDELCFVIPQCTSLGTPFTFIVKASTVEWAVESYANVFSARSYVNRAIEKLPDGSVTADQVLALLNEADWIQRGLQALVDEIKK